MYVAYPNISKIIGYNPHNESKPFYLMQGFNFIVYGKEKKVFHFPLGFESDGCTLKLRLLRLFFGCQHTPKYLIASLLHDFFTNNKYLIDRKTASEVFRYLLIKEGVEKWKANLMYFGVELYQKYWNRWK